MRYRIEITPLAAEDLESIGDYIAFELSNPYGALTMLREIHQTIDSLRQYPQRHALDSDELLARLGIRKFYYRHYKIFYLIRHQEVQILRVLHKRVDSRSRLYQSLGF